MNLDLNTMHGLHYSEEQFDAEVAKRLQQQIEKDGANWDEGDRSSYQRHFVREVYHEWNPGTNTDDFVQFETANSMKYFGTASMGYAQEDDANPLLEPIHGISLKDYAAIAANLGNFEKTQILAAFGIDEAIFDEVNTLWPKRMQEDESFTVATLYGQAFMEIGDHPVILKLKSEGGATSQGNDENLERLKTDKYFYLELEAARTAAYQYGIDGAQWIQDNFGVNLMDFQSAAMKWMSERNQNFNSEDTMADHQYQEAMEEEYKAKFAEEQGGNVADDIEF